MEAKAEFLEVLIIPNRKRLKQLSRHGDFASRTAFPRVINPLQGLNHDWPWLRRCLKEAGISGSLGSTARVANKRGQGEFSREQSAQ
jgi:hypothetical protein